MFNDYYDFSRYFFELLLSEWSFSLEQLAAVSLLLFFGLIFCLEVNFPHRKWSAKNLLQSYRTNFSLFLFNNILLSVLSVSTLLMLAELHSGNGLLLHISNPVAELILSFLILDFILYAWHVACHKFDSLWMFHKVHHSDPYLNVSTAFRMHTIELIIVTFLKAALIVVLGMDKMTVLSTETITFLFVMFHHTNIKFAGEKWLSRLIIVPFLHRTHHSIERAEHDNNYGAVLSIWDYSFGTLLNKEAAVIGIKNNSSLGFFEQLKFGFSNAIESKPLLRPMLFDDHKAHQMICEAAYFIAEKRDFYPGTELDDWLNAEREIKNQLLIEANMLIKKQPGKRNFAFLFPDCLSKININSKVVTA